MTSERLQGSNGPCPRSSRCGGVEGTVHSFRQQCSFRPFTHQKRRKYFYGCFSRLHCWAFCGGVITRTVEPQPTAGLGWASAVHTSRARKTLRERSHHTDRWLVLTSVSQQGDCLQSAFRRDVMRASLPPCGVGTLIIRIPQAGKWYVSFWVAKRGPKPCGLSPFFFFMIF